MENKIPSRQNWIVEQGGTISDRLSIENLTNMYIRAMFNKTYRMFEWKNLPDDMSSYDMEKFTQLQGKSFFIYHNNRYYVLEGTYFDNITWNKEPSKAIIVNAALKDLPKEFKLGENCIEIRNDSTYMGLYPINETNAIQLANVDISINYATFNTRLKKVYKADDDNTKESIDKLLDDVYKGAKITAIVTSSLYKDSLSTEDIGTTNTDIKDLIELKQYIKANWYMDLGINANYNMKRESLNENELSMNDDALLPVIDDMLECRKKACEDINKLFNLNISVDLSSSWKNFKDEVEMNLEMVENQVDMIENSKEDPQEDSSEEKEENKDDEKQD
jgi:hypothetical protein